MPFGLRFAKRHYGEDQRIGALRRSIKHGFPQSTKRLLAAMPSEWESRAVRSQPLRVGLETLELIL
jgi:hypothetical protein